MPKSKEDPTGEEFELDWIQLRKDVGSGPIADESNTEKFIRKFKESPLVPIGALATTFCLGYGLYSMRLGKSRMSQLMMRGRIVAQGFTIFAVVASLGYTLGK